MSMDDPGGDNLSPGAAERIVERTVDRRYLFKPKDEEVPPKGVNWFQHNYPNMPAARRIQVTIDPRPLADSLDSLIAESDFDGIVRALKAHKFEVVIEEGSPVIFLRLLP
jgi:hypothetical protein